MERRRILRYLPENYELAAANDRSALWAILGVMDEMHTPVDRILDSIDRYFDPFRSPDPFVLLQASWLGLDRYFDWTGGSVGMGQARYPAGTSQLRLLIAEFPSLVRSRGTRQSLTRFLEVATGVPGFEVVDGARAGSPFHLIVKIPEAASGLMDLVEKIVAGERPAHATYELRSTDTAPGRQKE